MNQSLKPPRDFGSALSILLGVMALLIGVGLSYVIYMDGLTGHRWQVKTLGPKPALVNDLPFVRTAMILFVGVAFTFLLAWVYRSGEWDRPALGILIFSLFADVVPGIFQFALLLIVIVLVERTIRKGDMRFPLTPLIFPLGLIMMSYSFTFVQAEKIGNIIPNMLFRMSYMSMVVLFPILIRTRKHLDVVLHFMIIATVMSTTVGIGQMVLSAVTGQPVTFTTADYNRINSPFGPLTRCTGLMLHPNHQSNALSAVAVLLLFFATRPAQYITRQRRTLYLVVAFYLGIGVLITFSRSGWLALGTCSLIIPLIRYPRYALTYLIVAGGILFVGFSTDAAKAFYEMVRDFNQASADFRWHIDHIAIQSFLNDPWMGRGVGQILHYFNPYHLEVHNTYLQALSEMGVIGILCLLSLVGFMGFRMLERIFNAKHFLDRDWIIGLTLAAGILAIQNLFAMFLWIKFLWALTALIETAVLVSKRHSRLEAKEDADDASDLIFLRPTPSLPAATPANTPANTNGY